MADRLKLTSENVSNLFLKCLFLEGEDTTNFVKAEGVAITIGFHPERLRTNKTQIKELLDQLPQRFRKSEASSESHGWSFLNACKTEKGILWGQHKNVDELLCLGLASGLIEYNLPREIWVALPSGVPYFFIK
ncbi:hypothetical protein [Leptospira sp. P2653]|uniref:hypothetical protein n=1 Tax=Leptospira sp. P2653 TaxID=1218600 RepID=UPI0002BE2985|nr:hypothetical protein [Leptospira sp. P2653]EMJ59882.1 hypothetical protein LEP1GSC051_0092 [Leptospira sp. P2653]